MSQKQEQQYSQQQQREHQNSDLQRFAVNVASMSTTKNQYDPASSLAEKDLGLSPAS